MAAKPQLPSPGIEYRNPRVYNLKYSFTIVPNPELINKDRDLKLWVPIPREWESQKAIKITGVIPYSHSQFTDPEHGNQILYWDFGTEPLQDSYTINIDYRLESFEIHADVDPEKVGTYDETNDEFELYTRSSRTIQITPKIKQLALEAIGKETNPFLKTKRIYDFAKSRMRYRFLEMERGRGTESLLNNPIIDHNSGKEYYEGSQNQYTIFFVALCRAAGIPTRTVQGTIGFDPRVKKDDLKPMSEIKISPAGLGGAQHYGCELWNGPVIRPITWAECYIPNYGWIPADLSHDFCHLDNWRIILSKGTDILIGPEAPRASNDGYGTQWVSLHEGRVDLLREPVWNILKIHEASIKAIHLSDPFPANAYAQYADYRWSSIDRKELLTKTRRKKLLSDLYNSYKRNESLNLQNHYAYYCHLFRQIVGDENFIEIFKKYHWIRISAKAPVQMEQFQELSEEIYGSSLDDYFKQWLDTKTVLELKLDSVSINKNLDNWIISGEILKDGSVFCKIPMEIAVHTEKGICVDTIWSESRVTEFEIKVSSRPKRIIVDPNFHIPCKRKMPAKLYMFWQYYPNLVIIYGTSKESIANRSTAEQFNASNLGLESCVIKPDTSVTTRDLGQDIVILVGRPETNKLSKRLENTFPIKFNNDEFSWQGITYKDPSQGIMQIVESPMNPSGWIVHYAGLSGDATLQIEHVTTTIPELFGGSYTWGTYQFSAYDANASYILFEHSNVITYGDWIIGDDLVWFFE